MLFTIVIGPHITPRHHMRQLWRIYVGISKLPRTMVWCLIHPTNWWWIVMLSIFMSPQSHKICINITIHHQFVGCIKHQIIVIGNLDIPTYILHSHIMWCLGVMCGPITMVNRILDIWYCVWCQIHHHPYNRSIWVGPISLILRTTIKVSPFNTVWLLPKYLIPYNKYHSIY